MTSITVTLALDEARALWGATTHAPYGGEEHALLVAAQAKVYEAIRATGELATDLRPKDRTCDLCGCALDPCSACRGVGDQRVVAGEDTDEPCRACAVAAALPTIQRGPESA